MRLKAVVTVEISRFKNVSVRYLSSVVLDYLFVNDNGCILLSINLVDGVYKHLCRQTQY